MRGFETLSDSERMWVTIILARFFRIAEQQLLHARQSHVDQQYFQSFERVFFEALTYPGVQQWWDQSGKTYSDEFQTYVTELVPKAAEAGYNSSFKAADYDST